jgi:hypothetical protein
MDASDLGRRFVAPVPPLDRLALLVPGELERIGQALLQFAFARARPSDVHARISSLSNSARSPQGFKRHIGRAKCTHAAHTDDDASCG